MLMLRSLISATKPACTSSMPKPIIRLGMTSLSSSVSRIMAMALSISSRIRFRPFSRCSRSSFLRIWKNSRRLTQSVRQAVHSSRISPTPITRGIPAMRMLKLQGKLSCKVVSRKSFCISFSGSTPRFRSMVSFRPPRSVSSRISAISLILPSFISSDTLSRMTSVAVV